MANRSFFASVLIGLSIVIAPLAMADNGIKTQQVHFKKGESGATIKGKIKGDETLDYTIVASKGQNMVVILEGKPYFNVLPPSSNGEALFVGSTSGNNYEGVLPSSGTYTIRVYQMGAASDGGKTNNFKLDIGVSGK